MQEHTQSIIARIQKLLALSQSSNEHEAAAALAKAQGLLAEYNVSMAQVQAQTGVKSTYVQRHVTLSGQDWWRRDLITALSRFNFCDVVYWTGSARVALVGEAENIEAVLLMYRFVEEQLEQFAASGYARYSRAGGRAHARSWKTSFYQGALGIIRTRLQAERSALERRPVLPDRLAPAARAEGANATPSCRALLVVKEQALKEAMQQFYPHARQRAVRRQITAPDGYAAGREAGSRVRFRQEVDRPRSFWS